MLQREALHSQSLFPLRHFISSSVTLSCLPLCWRRRILQRPLKPLGNPNPHLLPAPGRRVPLCKAPASLGSPRPAGKGRGLQHTTVLPGCREVTPPGLAGPGSRARARGAKTSAAGASVGSLGARARSARARSGLRRAGPSLPSNAGSASPPLWGLSRGGSAGLGRIRPHPPPPRSLWLRPRGAEQRGAGPSGVG